MNEHDESVTAYPLCWPGNWRRTASPKSSQYGKNWTLASARRELEHELELLGGKELIVSTNLRLTVTGLPHDRQVTPTDKGVAVYFKMKGKPTCFACDKWDKIEHNIRAIALAISSMRQLERCGSSEILERAFTGFIALPEPTPWWKILKVKPHQPTETIVSKFRELAKELHPDMPTGNRDKFIEIHQAYEVFKQERGL